MSQHRFQHRSSLAWPEAGPCLSLLGAILFENESRARSSRSSLPSRSQSPAPLTWSLQRNPWPRSGQGGGKNHVARWRSWIGFRFSTRGGRTEGRTAVTPPLSPPDPASGATTHRCFLSCSRAARILIAIPPREPLRVSAGTMHRACMLEGEA